MQIVMARIEEEQQIVKIGRIDLGEQHKFKNVLNPVSCMWLNKGTAKDVAKAKDYATREGYTVFTYQNERDPLAKAKQDILELR